MDSAGDPASKPCFLMLFLGGGSSRHFYKIVNISNHVNCMFRDVGQSLGFLTLEDGIVRVFSRNVGNELQLLAA